MQNSLRKITFSKTQSSRSKCRKILGGQENTKPKMSSLMMAKVLQWKTFAGEVVEVVDEVEAVGVVDAAEEEDVVEAVGVEDAAEEEDVATFEGERDTRRTAAARKRHMVDTKRLHGAKVLPQLLAILIKRHRKDKATRIKHNLRQHRQANHQQTATSHIETGNFQLLLRRCRTYNDYLFCSMI